MAATRCLRPGPEPPDTVERGRPSRRFVGAATVSIAHLRFVPAAAVLFHAGLLGMLVLAWREGRFDSRGPMASKLGAPFGRRPVGSRDRS